jgi:hypothetical protein
MTIVMIREESNHDLQHDLGHMEDQRLSGTLKSVAGVVLQVLDMRRVSGSIGHVARRAAVGMETLGLWKWPWLACGKLPGSNSPLPHTRKGKDATRRASS